MMRVLHVGKFYPPHPGGMERVVETLCQASRGLVQNHVLVSNHSSATVEETRDGVHVTRVGTIAAAGSVHIAPAFAAWLRKIPADLIVLHEPNPWALLSYTIARPAPLVIGITATSCGWRSSTCSTRCSHVTLRPGAIVARRPHLGSPAVASRQIACGSFVRIDPAGGLRPESPRPRAVRARDATWLRRSLRAWRSYWARAVIAGRPKRAERSAWRGARARRP